MTTTSDGPSTGPRRLKNGHILAQVPGLGPDGEIAEGLVELAPDHALYQVWDEWLKGQGR